MKKIDLDAVEKAVGEAEKRTAAEIVVVINRQSGSYFDIEVLYAAGWALLSAAVMIYMPRWTFNELYLLPDAVLIGLLALAVLHLVRPLKHAIIGRRRMDRHVTLHARNAYSVLHVTATKERTGLLVYVSLFEDRIHLLPDFGIEGKVAPAFFHDAIHQTGPLSRYANPTEGLCKLLASCGKVLSEKLPAGASDADELPNRPRLEVQ